MAAGQGRRKKETKTLRTHSQGTRARTQYVVSSAIGAAISAAIVVMVTALEAFPLEALGTKHVSENRDGIVAVLAFAPL